MIYSYLCEDISQATFLKCFLNEHAPKLELHPNFHYRYKAASSADVLKMMHPASIAAFAQHQIELLFIGIDYDDRDRSKFKTELKALYQKLPEQSQKQSIIFFPVQAIEYWLIILKRRKEKSPESRGHRVEKLNRDEAKNEIFPEYSTRQIREKVVKDIMKDADFDWLQHNSESFLSFYNDLGRVLQNS